jgi:hypothetical protein
MFYSARVSIRTSWNYQVTPERDSSTAPTTARLYQDYPSCPTCGLLDHASMFDDARTRVKDEVRWTFFWKREAWTRG